MKNNMILSVIVTTFNHEKYIEKCLNSIINQKVEFKYEIIIADDCSEDGTVELLKTYTGIKLIENKKNMGLCRNLDNAFRTAKGKYIFVCSGDDFLGKEDMLQKQVIFLEHNCDYFSVTAWHYFVNEQTGEKKVVEFPYEKYTLLDYLRGIDAGFYMGTFRNTYAKDKVSYLCKGSKNNEEIQMMVYLLSKGDKYIISEPMYVYCYRVSGTAGNYCSKNTDIDILADYAKGFYAVEEDGRNKKYNFTLAKIKKYDSYINRILDTRDLKKIADIGKVLVLSDIIKFIWYKFIIKLFHYQIPVIFMSEKRLIKNK